MLTLKRAKEIMNEFGFLNNNIEPIIYEHENNVCFFATYKTKYGHLSRVSHFNTEEDFLNNLKIYYWYRKRIKNEDVIVEFDNYENDSPKITVLYNGNEVNINNLNSIEVINKKVEVLDLDEEIVSPTKNDDNELFDKIEEEILSFKNKIDEVNNNIKSICDEYTKKMTELNNLFNITEKIFTPKYTLTDIDIYKNRINIIKTDVEQNNNSFEENIKKLIDIYYDLKMDENLLENIYLYEYYKNEINVVEEKINLYKKYLDTDGKKKLFKKNTVTFDEYYEENKSVKNEVLKATILSDYEMKVNSSLIELRNSQVEDLKYIYGIKTKVETIKKEEAIEFDYDLEYILNSLNSYFKNLNQEERNYSLLINSPLKDICNYILINNVFDIDKLKNNELIINNYEILSNIDNFALTKKYLRFLKLDSIEEFIESVVKIIQNTNLSKFESTFTKDIYFKLGDIKLSKYISTGLNKFPVNGIGSNDYYISKIDLNDTIMYCPFIISLNDDNILECKKNEEYIILDLEDYNGFTLENEVKVNNYLLKMKDEFKVVLLSQKNCKKISFIKK